MVDYAITTGIRKIGASILAKLTRTANQEWFTEDITILLSNTNILATIVVDFAFSVSTVVEYTLDGGEAVPNWIAFNGGVALSGGQSRFIDVTTGNAINFRATQAGDLIRCIVSSVP